MSDDFMKTALEEARKRWAEGGIPRVAIGENRTFRGPEDYVRSRGVEVTVVDDPACYQLMTDLIAAHPAVWNEDIGEESTCGSGPSA